MNKGEHRPGAREPISNSALYPTTFRLTVEDLDLLEALKQQTGLPGVRVLRSGLALLADAIGIPRPPSLMEINSEHGLPARRATRSPAPDPARPELTTLVTTRDNGPPPPRFDPEKFSARVAEAMAARSNRERRQITYDLLAQEYSALSESPITRSSIHRYAKADVPLTLSVIDTLARVLGVSPVWLAFG